MIEPNVASKSTIALTDVALAAALAGLLLLWLRATWRLGRSVRMRRHQEGGSP